MEFDNDGKVILQTINQKIEHEEVYNNTQPIRKLNKTNIPLVKFVYNYAKSHIYISKRMVSGVYITLNNPKHNRIDTKGFQKKIIRQLVLIFKIFCRLGFCERYGQNTVKINRDKLKKFSLDDILDYTIKN